MPSTSCAAAPKLSAARAVAAAPTWPRPAVPTATRPRPRSTPSRQRLGAEPLAAEKPAVTLPSARTVMPGGTCRYDRGAAHAKAAPFLSDRQAGQVSDAEGGMNGDEQGTQSDFYRARA